MSDKKHARLSPSASSRWINCPGSIKLAEQCPTPPDSVHAKEGTFAHGLAEKCLLNETDAQDYIGKHGFVGGERFDVDTEMAEAVQEYVEHVRSHEGEMFVEKKFKLPWVHKDLSGTNDACTYDEKNKTLYVYDYKHGKGVAVEVDWNSQLMIYGLGALHSLKKVVDQVVFVIVQPRAYHADGPIRSFTLDSVALTHWGLHVLKLACARTEEDNAPINPGTHCKWCPAAGVCSEKAKAAMAVAKTTFDQPVLPNPSELTGIDIAKVLGVAEQFSGWVDEVKNYAYSMLEQGKPIPGYKLVSKRANRKWSNEERAAQTLLSAMGPDAYKKKLVSPAQAEKAIKKLGLSPEAILQGLVYKPEAGLTLAPTTDKRKAVSVISPFIDDMDLLQ